MKGINEALEKEVNIKLANYKLLKKAVKDIEKKRLVTRRSIEDIVEQRKIIKDFYID